MAAALEQHAVPVEDVELSWDEIVSSELPVGAADADSGPQTLRPCQVPPGSDADLAIEEALAKLAALSDLDELDEVITTYSRRHRMRRCDVIDMQISQLKMGMCPPKPPKGVRKT